MNAFTVNTLRQRFEKLNKNKYLARVFCQNQAHTRLVREIVLYDLCNSLAKDVSVTDGCSFNFFAGI